MYAPAPNTAATRETPPEPSQPVPGAGSRAQVVAMLSPTPVPGSPPGSFLPGVQAAAAISRDGRIVAITRLENAAPGRPDGEVDTRPLRPIWEQAEPVWREPWNDTPVQPS